MKIAIFGANGPTGRILTAQALGQGHTITAVTRHPAAFPMKHTQLRVQAGDVFDYMEVETAVAGQDAIISTLGVPFSSQPISVYSRGTEHIIQAMRAHGVRRLVCVSSSATDPEALHHDTGGGFVFEKLLKPLIIGRFGRTLYEDMWKIETLVRASGLDWTIVRPSGLFETPSVTDYRVALDMLNERYTSRADLADCLLQQLRTTQYVHQAIAVATVAARPAMLQFILKEAFQRRPS